MELMGIGDEGASSIDGQIKAAQELGWKYIEMRGVQVEGFDKANLHEIPDEAFDIVEQKLKDAGVDVIVTDHHEPPEGALPPTFALVNEYRTGSIPIFHFDFYRLDAAEEVVRIGWDDYLDEDGVLLVEWADRFPELLPEHTRWIDLTIDSDGSHLITERAPAS